MNLGNILRRIIIHGQDMVYVSVHSLASGFTAADILEAYKIDYEDTDDIFYVGDDALVIVHGGVTNGQKGNLIVFNKTDKVVNLRRRLDWTIKEVISNANEI